MVQRDVGSPAHAARAMSETPGSKRLFLGIESCPCCNRSGKHLGVQCPFCDGGRVVSTEKADRWRAAHAKTDPAPDT
jgi:hypothetical protein